MSWGGLFESQTYNKIHSSSSNRTAPTKNLLVERKKRKKEEDRGGRVAVAKKEFGVMCQPNLRREKGNEDGMGWGYKDAKLPTRPSYCLLSAEGTEENRRRIKS